MNLPLSRGGSGQLPTCVGYRAGQDGAPVVSKPQPTCPPPVVIVGFALMGGGISVIERGFVAAADLVAAVPRPPPQSDPVDGSRSLATVSSPNRLEATVSSQVLVDRCV